MVMHMTQLVDAQELARRLSVPVSWIYDRTRKGGPDRLPFVKAGKYVRFSEEEVLEHLRQRTQGESESEGD